MTLKHSKYGESELLLHMLREQVPMTKEASIKEEVSYEVTGDIFNDILLLADGLRNKGFVAQADAIEEKLFIREAAKKKMEQAEAKSRSKSILDEAHPEGDVEVSPSSEGLGKVWTEQSAHDEIMKKVNKTPTGKYASADAVAAAQAGRQMAIQYAAVMAGPLGMEPDDIIDEVEGHLTRALMQDVSGYPSHVYADVARNFERLSPEISADLAKRINDDKASNPNYRMDEALRLTAGDVLGRAVGQMQSDYGREGKVSAQLDNIIKAASEALGLTKVALSDDVKRFTSLILQTYKDRNAKEWFGTNPVIGPDTIGQEIYSAYVHVIKECFNQLKAISKNVEQYKKFQDKFYEIVKQNIGDTFWRIEQNNSGKGFIEDRITKDTVLFSRKAIQDLLWGAKDIVVKQAESGNFGEKSEPTTKPKSEEDHTSKEGFIKGQIALYKERYLKPLKSAQDVLYVLLRNISTYVKDQNDIQKAQKTIDHINSHIKWIDQDYDVLSKKFSQEKYEVNDKNIERWTNSIAKTMDLNGSYENPWKLKAEFNKINQDLIDWYNKQRQQQKRGNADTNLEVFGQDSPAAPAASAPAPAPAPAPAASGGPFSFQKSNPPPSPAQPGAAYKGTSSGGGANVLKMEQLLVDLSKALKDHPKASKINVTSRGWKPETTSALQTAEEVRKELKLSDTTLKLERAWASIAPNIKTLEEMIKKVESGAVQEKSERKNSLGVYPVANGQSIELTLEDLTSLESLLTAMENNNVGPRVSKVVTDVPRETQNYSMIGGKKVYTDLGVEQTSKELNPNPKVPNQV